MLNFIELFTLAIKASVAAGEEILSVYNQKTEVELKADKSPLTIADKLSHKKVSEMLSVSKIPVLSEEGKTIDYLERKQ